MNDKRFIFVNQMKLSWKLKIYLCHQDNQEGKAVHVSSRRFGKLQYIQCINLKWKYNNRSNISLLLFEIYHSLANKYS